MTGVRPVRLTCPGYDVGTADIRAGGKRVGYVLGEFSGWRAYLMTEADPRPGEFDPRNAETVWRLTLREVREALRERVESRGPWWT